MLERRAELLGGVIGQVFAESEASVEVLLAAERGDAVDHGRFVGSEARGERAFGEGGFGGWRGHFDSEVVIDDGCVLRRRDGDDNHRVREPESDKL